MGSEFEMVMLEVGEAVAHVLLAGSNLLLPDRPTVAEDAHCSGDVVEPGIDHQFRADAAVAKLRSREIEIIAALEDVIGEFVSRGHADPPGRAVFRDRIDGCYFGLFAAVFCMPGNGE